MSFVISSSEFDGAINMAEIIFFSDEYSKLSSDLAACIGNNLLN